MPIQHSIKLYIYTLKINKMQPIIQSLRPFIGSKVYELSKQFYQELGWEVKDIPYDMSVVIINEQFSFYLQDYFVKDWVENTMLFLEIEDVPAYYKYLESLHLEEKYSGVKLHPIKKEEWGMEFFLTDPSTVLWHFGSFKG